MSGNRRWGMGVVVLAVIALLAGCAPISAPSAPVTEAGATEAGATEAGATEAGATEAGATEAGATEAAAAAGSVLEGHVTFAAESALPAGTIVRVEVIDPAVQSYPENVLTATDVAAGGLTSPVPFQLPVDGVSPSGESQYGIVAQVLLNGAPLFVSLEPLPLDQVVGSTGAVELPVAPLPPASEYMGKPAQAAGVVGGRVTWESGEPMPAGSDLVVEIVDTRNAGFGAEPFASTRLGVGDTTSPIVFELQVTLPDKEADYLIRAQVYQGETMTWQSSGAERWGTGDAPFTNIELPIVPVEGATAASAARIGSSANLTGTVGYLQRIALPEGAVIDVALVDLNVGAILTNLTMSTSGEQPPLPFTLTYDPAQIHPDGQYGLLARILVDDAPIFVTLGPVPVLTGGAPATDVNLVLDKLATETESAGEGSMSGVVTGNVTYRQRIALPPGAVVEVRLQDISRADAPATLVSQQVITTTGEQVPIPFSLPYNPADIDERSTYSVSARITIDGKLAWISDTVMPVITRGSPTSGVEVVVVQVR